MAFEKRFIQAREARLISTLASDGTEATVDKFELPNRTKIVTADLGSGVFGTLSPKGQKEEVVLVTAVTQNDDGTADITFERAYGFTHPQTAETAGLANLHTPGTVLVLSDTAAMQKSIIDYIDSVSISGAADAGETTKGIVEQATTAEINADTEDGSEGKLAINPNELAASKYGLRLPSSDEKAALAGTSGTPSSSNKFVTDSSLGFSLGGDGSDGALDTSSAGVEIDLDGEQFVTKNYSSINVVTNDVTFINPHTNGTIVQFRCQGDATISAKIDLKGVGAQPNELNSNLSTATPANGGTSTFNVDDSIAGISAPAPTASIASVSGGTVPNYAASHVRNDSERALFEPLFIAAGAAGGNGGGNNSSAYGAGGVGGDGGGALLLNIGGSLVFTGTIDVSGTDGEDSPDKNTSSGSSEASSGGAGGGGACGMVLVKAKTITTNTGTITATGGAGGDAGDATAGGDDGSVEGGAGGSGAASFLAAGGAGAAGQSSGAAGKNGTAAAGLGAGGGGGGGARAASAGTQLGGNGGAGGGNAGGVIIEIS